MERKKVRTIKKATRKSTQKSVKIQGRKVSARSTKRVKPAVVAKKTDKFTLPVYNSDGKTVGRQQLPKEIFGVKAAPALLALAVRVYLSNQRAGTASTKTRGEVRGGGRKPHRQKGTGRARAGSIRDPHWRGGGVVFGPKPRDFSLKMPKKARRVALFGALADKLATGRIVVVGGTEKFEPKTKKMVALLKKLELANEGKILWIGNGKAENVFRAGRNLPNLNFTNAGSLSTYQILENQFLIFEKAALEKLPEIFNLKG